MEMPGEGAKHPPHKYEGIKLGTAQDINKPNNNLVARLLARQHVVNCINVLFSFKC